MAWGRTIPVKVCRGVNPRLSPASVWPLRTEEMDVSKMLPEEDAKYKAKVTKKARSYSGPSSKYIKKKLFKKNKIVTVIGTYGKWSKLSTGQWIPSKRLKKN